MTEWNVKETPEAFGLKTVVLLEARGGYEFDSFLVLVDPDSGRYFWAADSGCSCPTPFESFNRGNMCQGSARDVLTDLYAWARVDVDRAAALVGASVRPWFRSLEVASG